MRQQSQKGAFMVYYKDKESCQLMFYTRTVIRGDVEYPAFDGNIRNAKVFGRRGSAEHAAQAWNEAGHKPKLMVMEDKNR